MTLRGDRTGPGRRRAVALASGAVLAAAACAGDPSDGGSALEVVYDTVGDTLVVRTVSGSVWDAPARLEPEVSIGELEGADEYLLGAVQSIAVGDDGTIYVVDRQVPDLRAFSEDGTYLATLGGPGEGPGELKSPEAGMAVLPDGRILVRDPGNARIQVYAPDGEAAGTWPRRGGYSTSMPTFVDREGRAYTPILANAGADVRDWQTGLVRFSADGTPGDTLLPPDPGYEGPAVEARTEGGTSRSSVPFSPVETWTFHPDGFFVHGISTDYAFTLHRPGAPLRVERVATPVPVQPGEKAEAEARTTRNMRRTDPNWRWNGPAIPDTKPPYQALYAGRDGRIWVYVATRGVRRDDPDYDPTDPDDLPNEWSSPIAFDVFEEDGRYLGRVETPEGFRLYPTPVIDGDLVWAVQTDELGVNRVVRYRVVRPST